MPDKKKSLGSPLERDGNKKNTKRASENKRTLRACDRCRFKKSKCDGCQPCLNCQLNARSCIYSARRRRDARNWYCHMQEIVDEGFQRLYKACKDADVFPGTLPEEFDGKVTTEDILRGLGLEAKPGSFSPVESWMSTTAASQKEPSVIASSVDADCSRNHFPTKHIVDGSRCKGERTGQRALMKKPEVEDHASRHPPSMIASASKLLAHIDMDMCQHFDDALSTQSVMPVGFVAEDHDNIMSNVSNTVPQKKRPQSNRHNGRNDLFRSPGEGGANTDGISYSPTFGVQPQMQRVQLQQQHTQSSHPNALDLDGWSRWIPHDGDDRLELDIDPNLMAQ